MPELAEEMYCSQQICIPPTFPYLLRQYAKAAIRTQPSDLLKWSTAYFRCLSINIPPPVKPRLEYPIPKSYFGLTPGWLRALIHQLQNNLSVSFITLWDRWTGACLEHDTLVKVLCLGGFEDNTAIPWLRFVALCAAHLSDNLTKTMILICQVLTEEPEGGSAMIPLETFTDLYQFLAGINASVPQVLKNIYFSDAALAVTFEAPKPEVVAVVSETTVSTVEESVFVEEEEVKEDLGPKEVEDLSIVISCPDVGVDDYKREEEFEILGEDATGDQISMGGRSAKRKESEGFAPSERMDDGISQDASAVQPPSIDTQVDVSLMPVTSPVNLAEPDSRSQAGGASQRDDQGTVDEASAQTAGKEGAESAAGEADGDAASVSFRSAPFDIASKAETTQVEEILGEYDFWKTSTAEEEEEGEEEGGKQASIQDEMAKYEDVYVEPVPGIGPRVPEHLVQIVLEYMRECASKQHGMVMPRNVQHYTCPPLEVLE